MAVIHNPAATSSLPEVLSESALIMTAPLLLLLLLLLPLLFLSLTSLHKSISICTNKELKSENN